MVLLLENTVSESKTQQALRLLRDEGLTPYAAAKAVGITPATVYAAIRREESKVARGLVKCPCCGTDVPADRINVPDSMG